MKKMNLIAMVLVLCVAALIASASTTHYSYNTPTVGGSQNTWGTSLNTIFNSIDSNIWSASNGTTIGLNSTTTGGNVALTNPINNVINLSETTTGKNLDLPPMNATASPVVGGTIWVNNIGANAFGVMAADNSTAIVTSLGASQGVTLQPLTNSTTNGTWQVYGPYLTAVGGINLGSSASATNPSISGATTNGFYTAGAGLVDVSIASTKTTEWSSTGEATTGLVSASKYFSLTGTNVVVAGVNAIHSTTATNALCLETTGADGLCQTNDQGVVIGAPTGASKGAGTLNATGLFKNGVAAMLTTHIQTFSASGTYTPCGGFLYGIVECWGGGGGGGGVAGVSSQSGGGAGGGAGGYSLKVTTSAAVGASQTVTIGIAGTAGTAGNNAGGNGGDTSLGAICVGKGGTGGGGSAGLYAVGGAGGVLGTGDIRGTGMTGETSMGATVTTFIPASGQGGSSSIGSGGRGVLVSTGTASGTVATGFGSGGAGGSANAVTDNAPGGAGTAGYVSVIEFCAQ